MDSLHTEMLFVDDLLHIEMLVPTNSNSVWIIPLTAILHSLEVLEQGLL